MVICGKPVIERYQCCIVHPRVATQSIQHSGAMFAGPLNPVRCCRDFSAGFLQLKRNGHHTVDDGVIVHAAGESYPDVEHPKSGSAQPIKTREI